MTEAQYRSLCEACDDVLKSEASSPDHIAVPWLHVIREHPATVGPYEWIFGPAGSGSRRARRALRSAMSSIGRLVKSATSGRTDGVPAGVSECDVLFVSHLTTPNQLGERDDAYFGSLPQALADSGYAIVIVLIDHTGRAPAGAASAWDAGAVPRIILASVMGLADEFDSTWRLLRASRNLNRMARRAPRGLTRTAASYAGAEALAGGASSAMRIARQVGRLAGALKPRAVVMTYEGHAWERMAVDAARSAAPGVRCVAYQHASLSRLSHAPTRGLGLRYDPDVILTPGDVSRRRLEGSGALGPTAIDVVGSARGFASAASSPPEVSSRGKVCLVLPEGYQSECLNLFLFSLDCALARPEVDFVWRLHPMTRMEDLLNWSSRLRELPPNISFSTSSLTADATRSRWALYRGSTAIIQAVGAGAVPVYLRMPGEMTIDPLYEVDGSRAIVETPADLDTLIDRSPSAISSEAWEYCAKMFVPFQADVMRRAVGQPRQRASSV